LLKHSISTSGHQHFFARPPPNVTVTRILSSCEEELDRTYRLELAAFTDPQQQERVQNEQLRGRSGSQPRERVERWNAGPSWRAGAWLGIVTVVSSYLLVPVIWETLEFAVEGFIEDALIIIVTILSSKEVFPASRS
jgi:hypothetical protein